MDKYKGAAWKKSSRSSSQDNCVEVARVPNAVGVRDSKAGPDGPVLDLDPTVFAAFIDDVRAGRFDLPD